MDDSVIDSRGLVSRIQDYSTKDGPGLRTTVFLMGCNLRCQWCANPENLEMRPRQMFYQERCRHCGACRGAENKEEICAHNAYETIGHWMSVEELTKKLLRNKDFFIIGKGGVTFSGGEPCLQPAFVGAMLDRLRREQIHTCLDTAGGIPSPDFLSLAQKADLVLLDIKAMNPRLHQDLTGVSNEQILANARLLAENHIPMRLRLVVVPGKNDGWEDLQRRIRLTAELQELSQGTAVEQVDLLPYHDLGASKYVRLKEAYPLQDLAVDQVALDSTMQKALSYARTLGLHATIGG